MIEEGESYGFQVTFNTNSLEKCPCVYNTQTHQAVNDWCRRRDNGELRWCFALGHGGKFFKKQWMTMYACPLEFACAFGIEEIMRNPGVGKHEWHNPVYMEVTWQHGEE
jgi:hypothetical protein